MEINSQKLKYRMYGLTNYQLTGIQQGIQFGHAVVEYGLKYFNTPEYQQWANEDKTFIILNGGTTNNNPEKLGTLNLYLDKLIGLSRIHTIFPNLFRNASFNEPDLGNQLTAFCFLVDERVWDTKNYPFQDIDSVLLSSENREFYLNILSDNRMEALAIHDLKEFIRPLKLA